MDFTVPGVSLYKKKDGSGSGTTSYSLHLPEPMTWNAKDWKYDKVSLRFVLRYRKQSVPTFGFFENLEILDRNPKMLFWVSRREFWFSGKIPHWFNFPPFECRRDLHFLTVIVENTRISWKNSVKFKKYQNFSLQFPIFQKWGSEASKTSNVNTFVIVFSVTFLNCFPLLRELSGFWLPHRFFWLESHCYSVELCKFFKFWNFC